jgi:uncharacterized membrane protein
MNKELIIAMSGGLGGMLGWGFADFFAKKTIDRIGAVPSLVWAHAFGTLAFFAVWLFQSAVLGKALALPSELRAWALLAVFGAIQAAVYILAYEGFGKGQIAILNPVFASFSGLTAILSIVMFGEAVSTHGAVGLLVVFLGILLISIDVGALRSRRVALVRIPGLKEVALATLLAAFWTVFWDQFIGGQDWLAYALLMYGFMTITLLIVAKAQQGTLAVPPRDLWMFLLLIGVCETVAYLAISLGYSRTSLTSVVALLSGAFSLPTIFLARAFLRERTTAVQTVGSFTVVLGIMLLALR